MALNYAEIQTRKQEIIAEMKAKAPGLQIAIDGDKIGFRHYVPRVHRSIVGVFVATQWITSKYTCDSLSRYYLTIEAAKTAIEPILPKAEAKRIEIISALEAVRGLGCDFGAVYCSGGDDHWHDYDYIEFEIEGFSFHYEI